MAGNEINFCSGNGVLGMDLRLEVLVVSRPYIIEQGAFPTPWEPPPPHLCTSRNNCRFI